MKKKGFFRRVFFPMVFGNLLAMALLVGGVIFGGLYFIDRYTLHGEYVVMPKLNGENITVALRKLESLGLRGEVRDTGYVEYLAGDIVLDQSIGAGTKIKPGRWISLVVNSTKERQVALPADIAGNCSLREAEMKLKARGFRIGPPEYVLGDKNWVYEIKVNDRVMSPGAMVAVKTPITLVVGDGNVEEEYSGGEDFYQEAFTDSMSPEDNKSGDKTEDALFE